jgi:hypothetical protein
VGDAGPGRALIVDGALEAGDEGVGPCGAKEGGVVPVMGDEDVDRE